MPHCPVIPSGFVIVTHPFHPLNGQRLEILYAKRRGAATVFVCAGGFSGQITLPESWTDRGEPPVALYWSKTLLSLLTWCFTLTAGTR